MHLEPNGDQWESLLRRPPVVPDAAARNAAHAGRVVLLTGAGGCIGSALARTIVRCEPRLLVLLDHSEQNLHQVQMELAARARGAANIAVLGDICDAALLCDVFAAHRPEIVYHAAAFKHVPLMETNPVAAVRNNAMGTEVLAKVAFEHGAECLVLISTDKAVNPHSVMGASKRLAEMLLLRWGASRTQMKAVRLGNVLGSQGSVVPLFKEQIARGGPVRVTHPDVNRYFLTLDEAIDWIVAAGSLGESSGIFVPEMGEPVKITDLARHLIRMAGFVPETGIPMVFTGLRPGDKMAEELISNDESIEPTAKEKLFRVKGPGIHEYELDSAMRELEESVRRRDVAAVLDLLCGIVPAYRPSETLREFVTHSPA